MASTIKPRDPVPVSTQCAYESWNTTTDCWNYRSCQQCLQTKGCMIGKDGVCTEISQWTAPHNYSRAFEFELTLPAAKDTMNDSMKVVWQEWEFRAFEATYCPSDDAICQQCIQEQFWFRGYFRDSRFCVGANGCVCVLNCEFTTWNPACGDMYLPQTLPPAISPPQTQTESPSNSSIGNGSEQEPSMDDCGYIYTNPTSGCYKKRSCKDCLEIPGCVVSADGSCKPSWYSKYYGSSDVDYRVAIQSNRTLPSAREKNASALAEEQHWSFPSRTLSYCPTNDAVCQECIAQDFWLNASQSRDSRFCISETNGTSCVCVANCVRDDNAAFCPSPVRYDPDDDSEDLVPFIVFVIVSFIVGIVLIVWSLVCLCRCWHRRRRERMEAEQVARLVSDQEAAAAALVDPISTQAYVVVRPT